MAMLIDVIIAGLVLGVWYALISEGLWGAALMFFNVTFGAMIAFNFYEPLARMLDSTGIGWGFSDTLCMLGLFIVSVLLLRMTTETLAPAMVRFPPPVYQIGRFIFGLGAPRSLWRSSSWRFTRRRCTRRSSTRLPTRASRRSGSGSTINGWAFSSTRPARSSPVREWARATRFTSTGAADRSRCLIPCAEWLIVHQDKRPYKSDGGDVMGGGTAAATEEPAAGGEAAAGQGAAAPGPGGGGPRGRMGRGGGGPPGGQPPN